jgi:hypothetical protein
MYSVTETGTSLVGYGIEVNEAKAITSTLVLPPNVKVEPGSASIVTS